MCRIESPALQAVESAGAAEIKKRSDDKIIAAMQKSMAKVLERRGFDPARAIMDESTKAKVRKRIQQLADAAGGP